MAKKTSSASIDQTAHGSDNIQVAGSKNIINRITNFFQVDPKQYVEQHNRRVLLDHIENFWVKSVLEKSLHGAALLELGIKEDPRAVSFPWMIKKESTSETLPKGKSMLEIFREVGMGRALLILGAPGSGKTTMLLELARQLVERARQDETEAMPVVFNLASWKEKQSLSDWIAEQLNIIYYVPKKTALVWVNENRILLLLDGLDEVKGDSRAKCVEAVNQFRNEHGLTSLVVCSRIEEYRTINKKLSLEGAITLQPLTSKQINAYFDRFGKGLASIKQLLKKDKGLQELAEVPLMLSIMTLAYKDLKAGDLLASRTVEDRRKHLFNTYVDRMFERPTRSAKAPFTKPEILHYLSWLARMMIQNNIITYQIESMQPSWLVESTQRRLYRLYVGLLVGLSFVLLYGLFFGLLSGPSFELLYGLPYGLIVGLLGAKSDMIVMVDRLTWSRKGAWRGLSYGLLGGLLGLLLLGLFGWLGFGLLGRLSFGLLGGLRGLLLFGLLGGLLGGLVSEQVEETTYPGQRLKRSLFSSLLLTLFFGLFVGLFFGLLYGLVIGLVMGLFVGLSLGLLSGMYGSVFAELLSSLRGGHLFGPSSESIFDVGSGGYFSLIQHYSLRLVLAQRHLLPRQLIAFLEHSVDLIFLRRVGGSYIFIHRLIMEHFAEMDV